jgi:GntR family transcriptional regulator
VTESRFDLDSIREIFQDRERTLVKFLQISLARADAETVQMLSLPIGERIILIRRLLLRDNRPALSHEGRIRCDPTRPVVEAELSTRPVSDLFTGHGRGAAKKGELTLIPTVRGEQEAGPLSLPVGSPVFAWSIWFMTSTTPPSDGDGSRLRPKP